MSFLFLPRSHTPTANPPRSPTVHTTANTLIRLRAVTFEEAVKRFNKQFGP